MAGSRCRRDGLPTRVGVPAGREAHKPELSARPVYPIRSNWLKILPRKHRDYLLTSVGVFATHEAYKAREVWGADAPKTITYANQLFRTREIELQKAMFKKVEK